MTILNQAIIIFNRNIIDGATTIEIILEIINENRVGGKRFRSAEYPKLEI